MFTEKIIFALIRINFAVSVADCKYMRNYMLDTDMYFMLHITCSQPTFVAIRPTDKAKRAIKHKSMFPNGAARLCVTLLTQS